MAITQEIIPQEIMPAYNENIFAVKSSNVSQERFNYVFDLYDYQNSFLSRIKMPPRPDGYCVFDSHRIMENYVSYDFDPNATGYTQNPNSYCVYKIYFGESYVHYWDVYDDIWWNGQVGFYSTSEKHNFSVGDKVLYSRTDPTVTANTNYIGVHTITNVISDYQIVIDMAWGESTVPGTNAGTLVLFNKETTTFSGISSTNNFIYQINAVKEFEEFNQWNFEDYNINTTQNTTKKLLTTIPTSGVEVRRTDKFWLSFMSNQTYGSSTGIIKTYDASGTLLGKYKTYNQYGSLVKTQERFVKIGIGPAQLNSFDSSNTWVMSGSLPILTDNVKSYSFNFGSYNYSQAPDTSQTYTFDIDDECALWSTVRLVFLDRMGSFVGYNFRGGSKNDTSIERTNYRKGYGTYSIPTAVDTLYSKYPSPDAQFVGTRSSTRGTWGYNSQDRGLSTISTDIDEYVTVYSSWESQEIGDWLAELATSPVVYQQLEDGTFKAVTIEDMQIEVQKRENGDLIGYEFRFKYSNKNNVQRG